MRIAQDLAVIHSVEAPACAGVGKRKVRDAENTAISSCEGAHPPEVVMGNGWLEAIV